MARRTIAVFGSSEPAPGDALYAEATAVGRLLAEAGFDVITGGYGGVMEGASRGAREAGGGALGVTAAIFGGRRPNAFLDQVVEASDLHDRTRELIDRASGFIVLHGRAGTLFELAALWALDRAGGLGARPVVLLGGGWSRLLERLTDLDMLDWAQLEITSLAATPEAAVARLAERLERAGA